MKYLILLLAIVPSFAIAQVGIGTNSPVASAQLEVVSTTKGFLPSRMTTAQRNLISSPATGLIIYNTSTNSLDVYSGAVWISFGIGLGTQSNNTSLGSDVLTSNTTGSSNVGVGYQALNLNTTGGYNVATGYQSLKGNTTGSYNIASGFWALRSNGTGTGNVGIGFGSIYYNSGGHYNTATGYNSLFNTLGSYNVGVGYNSLQTNTTGTNNTAIGASSDVGSATLTNSTAIGYGAIVATSNTIQLGNGSVTSVKTSGAISTTSNITATGSIGAGTASPSANAALEVSSTNKGLLLPRLTTSQIATIPLPDPGLLIFNTSTGKAQVYTNTSTLWLNTNPSNVATTGATYTGPGDNDVQTITAPSSEKINTIQAKLSTSFNTATQVVAYLYSGTGVYPNGTYTLLGTSNTVTTSAAGGWHTFTFASPVSVTYNTVYYVVLKNQGTGDLYIENSDAGIYSGGSQFGDVNPFDLFIKINVNGGWSDLN